MDQLFSDESYRYILSEVLALVEPPAYRTIALLNRYCASMTRTYVVRKQHQWLEPMPAPNAPNGQVNWRFRHNKRLHGPYRFYMAFTGVLTIKQVFNSGRAHGPRMEYDFFDKSLEVRLYKHGRPSSIAEVYHCRHVNNVWYIGHIKKVLIMRTEHVFTWEIWRGMRLYETHDYDNKARRCVFRRWHHTGRLAHVKPYARNRALDGNVIKWNVHGQIIENSNWLCGKPCGQHDLYWPNGRPRRSTQYNQLGMRHGAYKIWNRAGVLIEQGNYLDGLKHGQRKIWFASGRPHKVMRYARGILHGKYIQWDEHGRVTCAHYYHYGRKN